MVMRQRCFRDNFKHSLSKNLVKVDQNRKAHIHNNVIE